MKVTKIIAVPEEIEITGATLLSIEESEALPLRLRVYKNVWWLRAPGRYYDCAECVLYDGYSHNVYVRDDGSGVRPALQIKNLESSNLKIGDLFIFGKKKFEIVSDSLAFCIEDIGKCCFRKDWRAEGANDYEKSDVKKFVDAWFAEASK